MRRWSTLKSFLVGAVPTALVFGVVLLALPERPSPEPERTVQLLERDEPGSPTEPEPSVEDEEPRDEGDQVAITDAGIDAAPDAGPPVDAEPEEPEAEEVAGLEPEEEEVEVEEEEEEEEEEEVETGPICGPVTCPVDFVCCNASCGICTLPGRLCSQTVCGMPMTPDSIGCGPVTCNVGEICCDPACGRCIDPGEPCLLKQCLSPIITPYSDSCGMQTCNTGFVCCNASCGICARPGETCRREPC